MEKRLLYAFIIIFIFLIGYHYLVSKYFPNLQPQSIQEQGEKKQESLNFIDEIEEKLPEIKFNDFIITYSPTGGYIKKIFLPKYNEELKFKNIGYIAKDKDKIFNTEINNDRIIFTNEENIKKEFIFDDYIVKINLSYPTTISEPISVFYSKLDDNTLGQNYQEIFISRNTNIERSSLRKFKYKESLENVKFAGLRDQYFCISLLTGSYTIRWEKNNKNTVFLSLLSPSSSVSLYIGPQIEKELKKVGLEGIIHYGFFDGISIIIIKILHFLHSITKNWGISIIFLTIIIYFILFPFTISSTKTMKKMREIQPKINELKEKYKNDLQKIQREQLELFKKYRINPLGGCLPLLFQIPVFFALFQVFSRLVELKGVRFLWIKDLTLSDKAFKIPFNLPYFGEYINILPILMILINVFQQKFTPMASTSSEQKFMSLFLLGFMGVIFYHFPSSLVLYWLTQNLLTFAYQVHFWYAEKHSNFIIT